MSEKLSELEKLKTELEVQRTAASQVTDLKSQLDAQKQKNNVSVYEYYFIMHFISRVTA